MSNKGQNLRVFVGDKCIAVATSCQFHVGLQLENASTKDDTGMWQKQEVVGKSWDVSCDTLYDPEATTETNAITPAELAAKIISEANPEVTLKWDATGGDKNRTGKGLGYTGKALYNDLSVSAPNRGNSTATHQFTGNGPLMPLPEKTEKAQAE